MERESSEGRGPGCSGGEASRRYGCSHLGFEASSLQEAVGNPRPESQPEPHASVPVQPWGSVLRGKLPEGGVCINLCAFAKDECVTLAASFYFMSYVCVKVDASFIFYIVTALSS